ncbi:hypothetical protein CEUSTIGMA_g312.t1 [Chlamydomonas eustigma]|uniref:Uncharacterized protein n=1 Tax=Chlamydomonas eustigma TaxID=1157962 RepID=A0A250WPT5_9CHLO|nr:hypothetical protein CEUSTIGMA_g312.t1 [Chlamydomonas eustigma]|eukprot:GAX72857.1 hypothetical protein CEUSTIGMA_g312.t1 [Chlamydomonas eustigma]
MDHEYAIVTLRSRVVLDLPSQYRSVFLETRPSDVKTVLTSEKVSVRNGAAVIDFWARIPCPHTDSYNIDFVLRPTSAHGAIDGIFQRAQARSRHGRLVIDTKSLNSNCRASSQLPLQRGQQMGSQQLSSNKVPWHRAHVLLKSSITNKPLLRRLDQVARSVGSTMTGVDSATQRQADGAAELELSVPQPGGGRRWAHSNRDLPEACISVPQEEAQPQEPTSPETYQGSKLTFGRASSPTQMILKEPSLVVEYCLLWLPPTLARLPELDLSEPLSRSLHCYAHGGFMGAALSLMADPEWEYILMEAVGESNEGHIAKKVLQGLGIMASLSSSLMSRDMLPFMSVLENSPVLCAYGLDRMGCTTTALPIAPFKDPEETTSALNSLSAPWWDADRPDLPHHLDVCRNDALEGSTIPSNETLNFSKSLVEGNTGPESVIINFNKSFVEDNTGPESVILNSNRSLLPAESSSGLQQGSIEEKTLHRSQKHKPLSSNKEGGSALLEDTRRYLFNPDGLPVNRYGYSPLSLEWDLWLDPSNPSDLRSANVDHGSPSHLIQQALSTSLKCRSVARKLGKHHNRTSGITPLQWLQQFGRSLNMGCGLKLPHRPLPLGCYTSSQSPSMALYENGQSCPSLQSYLHLEIQDMQLTTTSSPASNFHNCFCRVRLLGNAMSRPPLLLGPLDPMKGLPESQGSVFQCPALLRHPERGYESEGGENKEKDVSTSLYPLNHDLSTTLLVYEVYSGRHKNTIAAWSVLPLRLLEKHLEGWEESEALVTLSRPIHLKSSGETGATSTTQAERRSKVERASTNHGSGVCQVAPGIQQDMVRVDTGGHALGIHDIASLMMKEQEQRNGSGIKIGAEPEDEDERSLGEIAWLGTDKSWEYGITADFLADEQRYMSVSKVGCTTEGVTLGPAFNGLACGRMPGIIGKSGETSQPPLSFSSVKLKIRVRRMSVMQAAEQLYGIKAEVAQSYMAMLAAPGGLYLDIKSAYSKPQHLKWFASTLEGIGVHVKAICSFLPSQIDFRPLKDTEPFGGMYSSHAEAAKLIPFPRKQSQHLQSGQSGSRSGNLSHHDSAMLGQNTTRAVNTASSSISSMSVRKSDPDSVKELAKIEERTYDDPPADQLSLKTMDAVANKQRRHTSRVQSPTFGAVLFFHGLNGLELACEKGKVASGTCVLFNGASLIHEDMNDMMSGFKGSSVDDSPSDFDTEKVGGHSFVFSGIISAAARRKIPELVDLNAWNRYCTVLQVFKISGGIYVQEPDASPASVAALIQLVNNHPSHFPLGFAYGHLGSKAVAVSGHRGRGLAAQQLLEEFSSQEGLNGNVRKWIRQGVHLRAGDEVYISWGRRLLHTPGLLYCNSQALILRLLADFPEGDSDRLRGVVQGIGGLQEIFGRFFQHYVATSYFTLFELGFNFNYTKALTRLMRNRGILAGLRQDRKVIVAQYLTNCTYGDMALNLHHLGRADMHKLAKEAFTCLLESCTQHELQLIIEKLGGYRDVQRRLRGWLFLQGLHYEQRLRAVIERHKMRPQEPAYTYTRYGYVRYANARSREESSWQSCLSLFSRPYTIEDGVVVTEDPRHTRQKTWCYKATITGCKLLMCGFTWTWSFFVTLLTCCLYCLFACPTFLYPYCRNKVIPYALTIAFVSLVIFIVVIGGIGTAILEGYIHCSSKLQGLTRCTSNLTAND